MLKELAETSLEEKACLMALAVIDAKVKSLPPADRDDLFEVIKEFITATDEEDRQSAARAIQEITASPRARVRGKSIADGGQPVKWVAHISRRIRDLRTEQGMTQDELAERSGLTQSHLCRLERGDHSPNGLTLQKIAKGLGVSVSALDPSPARLSDNATP